MGGPWRGAPPPFFPSMEPDAGSRAQINRIIPRVYLTSYEGVEDVEELKRIKCTHIAAIGHEFLDNSQHPAAKELAGVKFYNLDISDDDNAPIGPALRAAATFIHDALQGSKKAHVVVHCAAGDSRSATIVMAYMLAHCKYELRKAFSVVRQNRPCVWPNNGFMSALVAFEAQTRRPKDKKKPPTIAIAEYEHWGEYAGLERGSDDYGDPFFEGLAPSARRALAEQSTRDVIDRRAGRPRQSRTSSVEGRRPSILRGLSHSRSWGVVLRVNSMRRANSMRRGVSGRLSHAGHPAHPVVPDGGSSHRGGAGGSHAGGGTRRRRITFWIPTLSRPRVAPSKTGLSS